MTAVARSEVAAKVVLFERRAVREREGRKRAEALLEEKSRELYLANFAAERAARAKIESERRYRGLFETAQEGILLVDLASAQVTDANAALLRMLGLPRAAVVGHKLCDLAPLAANPTCRTLLDDVLATGQLEAEDWLVQAPDGATAAVRADSHLYWVEGARIVQCSLRDITDERRRAQEAAEIERAGELLRRTAGVYLWRYNPEAGEYETDPDFSRPFEDAPRERRVAAFDLQAGVHREDAARLEQPFRQTLATGEGSGADYRILDANRRWRHMRSAWTGARRLAGGLWEVLGVTQDVTELMAERDRARAGVEAKSHFLANISHELRTPMNGVLGVLHLLRTADEHEVRARLVDEALSAGEKLADLLGDIVAFSDLETDSVVIQRGPTDVAQVLEDAVGPLRDQALQKGLWLRVEAGADLGLFALDGARLRQLLFSLVANAVKFTVKGGVDVRALVHGHGEATRLRVEVRDTGVGVSAEAKDRLFSEFAQVDETSTRRFGGVGLGLAIARRLAQLMDGEVDFISCPGEGSTFWVDIPAAACAEAWLADDGETAWLEGLRVLVVEDNPTNQLVAASMLRHLGAQVATADDGAQGVEAASHEAFDLILMDIQMPVMDGLEAARRIRALSTPMRDVPIVAFTANVLGPQLQAYSEAGMNGCIAKPFSPATLLAELSRLANDDRDATSASANSADRKA